jgi:uncharacterized protein YukJ
LNFNVANAFAVLIQDIDHDLASYINEEFSFALVARVVKTADNGAFDVIDLRDASFSDYENLRAKAVKYAEEGPENKVNELVDKFSLCKDKEEFVANYLKTST